MKVKVYISGPMRSKPLFNFPAFKAAAKTLRGMGYHVFNPAEFDEIYEPDQPVFDTVAEQENYSVGDNNTLRRYVRRDCHILINEMRPENGDFMVILPDWEQSQGARAEIALAGWLNMNVVKFHDLMVDSIRQEKEEREKEKQQ